MSYILCYLKKLVRSAIPAIAGSDMEMSTGAGATRSTVQSMDISMDSMSSLGSSSILDHSMVNFTINLIN